MEGKIVKLSLEEMKLTNQRGDNFTGENFIP